MIILKKRYSPVIIVISGDYNGSIIESRRKYYYLVFGYFKAIKLDEKSVKSYKLLNRDDGEIKSSYLAKKYLKYYLRYNLSFYPLLVNFRNGKSTIILANHNIYSYFIMLEEKIDNFNPVLDEEGREKFFISENTMPILVIVFIILSISISILCGI